MKVQIILVKGDVVGGGGAPLRSSSNNIILHRINTLTGGWVGEGRRASLASSFPNPPTTRQSMFRTEESMVGGAERSSSPNHILSSSRNKVAVGELGVGAKLAFGSSLQHPVPDKLPLSVIVLSTGRRLGKRAELFPNHSPKKVSLQKLVAITLPGDLVWLGVRKEELRSLPSSPPTKLIFLVIVINT